MSVFQLTAEGDTKMPETLPGPAATDEPVAEPRTRRAMLAGALGGLGAALLGGIVKPPSVRAAGDDGAAVVVAGTYADVRTQTTLGNAANNNNVLWVASNGDLGNGFGVAITGFSAHGQGVRGSTTSGIGVSGGTSGGPDSIGVRGISIDGHGVWGQSTTNAALRGTTISGYGLQTWGRLKLEPISGVAAIPAGSTSVTVTPGVDITSSSFVLLTPKVNLGGRSLWFATSTSTNTFTIRVSSPRSSVTRVAWLVIG